MPIEVKEYIFEDFDSSEGADNSTENNHFETRLDTQKDKESNKKGHNISSKAQVKKEELILDKEAIKKELEAIIESTKEEALKQAQLIKEQAKKEGFELGYKDGYEKGLNDAKGVFDKTVADYTSKMQQAIEKLIDTAKDISKRYEELENVATDMVLNIAKKVIAKELDSDRDIIKNMVREAMGLSEARKIKLKLNPEDAEVLKDVSLDKNKTVEVVEDKNLSRGSVIIEEENGNVIDASVNTKLDQIKNSIVNE
ncbi:FliH/SctL family protein [Hippea maritima]|uniref:Flagellar assembly protein FliH n=1 Tax=Hippea maritima (strain ATCC 700847 / DSM 10411 / MH2) TaxID=760142 RepID=F2LWX7_HIPMA|nr:FliH/SctL family protein [Hippea maritima]AEA34161.1 Flagellar assembly protein FliH/Type III secretion system HrpE [Hippea maritima DSM 10411]